LVGGTGTETPGRVKKAIFSLKIKKILKSKSTDSIKLERVKKKIIKVSK
jgi:hypothetical protein